MECSFEFELVSTYTDPAEDPFLNGKNLPLTEVQQVDSFKLIPTKNQKKIETFDVDVSFISPSNMECSFEFELVSTYSDPASAEELFFNGEIRPSFEQQQAESLKSIPHIDGEIVEENHDLASMNNKGLTSLGDLLRIEIEQENESCMSTIDEDKLVLIREAIQESIKKCRDDRNFPRSKNDYNQNLRKNNVHDEKEKSVEDENGIAHQIQVYRSSAEKVSRRYWFLPYMQCLAGCNCKLNS